MNPYIKLMNELEADGITFYDYFTREYIASYTKQQLSECFYIPKTGYYYWKIHDGRRVKIIYH